MDKKLIASRLLLKLYLIGPQSPPFCAVEAARYRDLFAEKLAVTDEEDGKVTISITERGRSVVQAALSDARLRALHS